MMRFKGWAVTAGLLLAASAANAQTAAPGDAGRSSYRAVSDFDGPYGDVPPAPPPPPVYNYGGGYGAPLMPPQEVYTVLRDNGFSPLGAPRQRGFVYFIAVVDRRGDDGRLVIDARDGRILRFVPSNGYGPGPYGGYFRPEPGYGPETSLPPPTVIRGVPRPPALVPHVASRAVPLPAPKPAVAGGSQTPAQQSAAIESKPESKPPTTAPAQAQAGSGPSATTVGEVKPQVKAEVKPAPAILPTQAMPKAQGLD
jgi:hypothetical protein